MLRCCQLPRCHPCFTILFIQMFDLAFSLNGVWGGIVVCCSIQCMFITYSLINPGAEPSVRSNTVDVADLAETLPVWTVTCNGVRCCAGYSTCAPHMSEFTRNTPHRGLWCPLTMLCNLNNNFILCLHCFCHLHAIHTVSTVICNNVNTRDTMRGLHGAVLLSALVLTSVHGQGAQGGI